MTRTRAAALSLIVLLAPSVRADTVPVWVPVAALAGAPPPVEQAVSAFPSGVGYVARMNLAIPPAVDLFRTTDFGLSWTAMRPGVPAPGGFTFVRFSDERTGWAADWSGVLRVSRDAGATWARAGRLPIAADEEVHFEVGEFAVTRGGGTIVVGGRVIARGREGCDRVRGDSVFWSTDGGRSWRRHSLPAPKSRPGPAPLVARVTAYDRDRGSLLVTTEPGTCATYGGHRLAGYVTSDAGRSWRRVDPALPGVSTAHLATADWVDPRTIVTSWSDGTVRVSRDAGRTFRTVQKLVTNPAVSAEDNFWNRFTALTFDGHVGFGAHGGGTMWRSLDGGLSWAREETLLGMQPFFHDIAAFDAEHAVYTATTWTFSSVAGVRLPLG